MTRLLKFLKGYVVIRLSGYAPERFFNLCSRHQIVLWGIQSVGTDYEMCISISGFRKLRPLVHKTRTTVRILEKHGLPFLLFRYRKRKLFAVGAVSGLVFLYLLSLFIWNIHIEGNYSLSDETVLNYLESEEICHGMRKKKIHGEEIEEKLREHFSEITWTSVEVKGTRLIVHIQENEDTKTEQIDKESPADIVASDAGVIVSMIVRNGTPVVSEGMQVEKGDLLVASQVEVLDDAGEIANTYYVHADADIQIQKTEQYQQSFAMSYKKKVYTGKEKTSVYLLLGNRRWEWKLFGRELEQSEIMSSEIPLKLTENFYLPIVFGKNTKKEYYLMDAIYSEDEANARAKEELKIFFEKLQRKGIQIIENNVRISKNELTCTANGTYVLEKSAVQEKTPEINLPEEEFDRERE